MTVINDERHEDDPTSLRVVALSLIMVLLALGGVSGAVTIVVMASVLSVHWNLVAAILFALNLVAGGIGIWGLLRLKPWKFGNEPVSSATLKAKRLFAWSGVLPVPAMVLLLYAARENPPDMFSNSPIPLGIAIAASAFWLLGMALAWWWYASTDEHDRKAYDVGNLVGGGLFLTVTPAWWIAARAGLLPQPNAMVLWLVTIIVLQLGWMWRRYR